MTMLVVYSYTFNLSEKKCLHSVLKRLIHDHKILNDSGHLSDPCVFVFQFSDVASLVRIQKGFTIICQRICRKLEGLLQGCSK
jgi:hypothetical protein